MRLKSIETDTLGRAEGDDRAVVRPSGPLPEFPCPSPLPLSPACPAGIAQYSPGCGGEHCEIPKLLQRLEDMENTDRLLGPSCRQPIQSHGTMGVPMPAMIQLNTFLRT